MKVTVFTTLLLTTVLLNLQSQAQCHFDDWTALKALYESTDGDNWKNNDGWEIVKQNSPPIDCNLEVLYGVGLGDDDRVDDLYLRVNQLSGNLPTELGNLTKLTSLFLYFNQLSGNIPAELGNLSNLTYLNIGYNQMNGDIPIELGNLNNLTELALHDNQLSGSIPAELGNLNKLTNLSLSSNELIGTIPAEIGNLDSLTDLNLSNNELDGSIPPELGNLNNLNKLYLNINQLSGNIPLELGNLDKLTDLRLWSNELGGSIPSELGNLSKLTYLSLSSNQLIGNIPSELGNLNNLTDLSLSSNELSGSIPSELGNLNNLTALGLSSNELSGNIPPEIGNLSSLTDLNLSWNALGGSIPAQLGNLSNLNDLRLSFNNLNSSIPTEIGNLNNLTRLWLDNNTLSGSIPRELGNLNNLADLSLSWNELSGNIPSEIGDLSNLTYLFLFHNQLSGSIPPEIGNLNNLTRLSLSGNQLSGIIPPAIGNLSNLTGLGLSENELSGSIPFEIGNLNNLTYLRLSGNQLSGNIPPELDNLSNLTRLRLSNNQLSGNIPSEIGNLNNLTLLWLENNELSGNIPTEIGDLNSLTHLWLENNELSGSIPSEIGNLNNLTDLSLENNELSGSIPPELGNLNNLTDLSVENNELSGSIPPELGNLNALTDLSLENNKLSGTVPSFTNLNRLNLENNHFSCSDISINFIHNQQIATFSYSPQKFTPLNYSDIQSIVLDSLIFGQSFTLNLQLPSEFFGDFTYQWRRETSFGGSSISASNQQPILNFENFQYSNVGKYTLEITDENCLPDGSSLEMESEPIYIIAKGYDLYGQPVEYTQLMVEFENQAAKDRYEQEIFLENGGIWADKCDCNRELHLYDFPDDESQIEQAYIALDQKIANVKSPNEIDGGFNYQLNNTAFDESFEQAYNVVYNYPNEDYPDNTTAYILDSGLDESNFDEAFDYLLTNAPIDSCYNFNAPGYNHTKPISNLYQGGETIDTDYMDRVGHGTFGFRAISEGLQGLDNGKIVPLKIIENATNGNLFDLICAMYHAVDHNADVINISAGYRGEASGILADAIYQAREKGIFVVAAAGNDGRNIDNENEVPQYPAYYASQYHKFYNVNDQGEFVLDSIPYDNLISVAAVNVDDQLWGDSNYGKQSVTLAAPGENIFGYQLAGKETVGSGTSIATFLATQVLAREIARDNSRSIEQIWADFESTYLVSNPNLINTTSTGKQINFDWYGAEINGCTDPIACNFNPYASNDDDSCSYCAPIGCTDCSDECQPCSPVGCMDTGACNYNPNATIEDNSQCVYDDCSSEADFVICPGERQVTVCAPVSPPPPLNLQDFATTSNVTLLSALSLQVIQKTDAFKYYNTTTYDYIVSDGTGNQTTCQTQYHIANQFLQEPEITDPPVVCQDDLWSHIKLGVDEYKIYANNNGSQGEELTACNTPGLHCSTSSLEVNTTNPGTHQFWVTQFFNFPNGAICESTAAPFSVEIYPKPVASLSATSVTINPGQGIALMDMITDNTSGYWTGENILYLLTADGTNIPYFSSTQTGSYKLYYAVKNEYCQDNYLLIVNVNNAAKIDDKAIGQIPNVHRFEDSQTFDIYPNPASDLVHITLPDNDHISNEIQLLDLTGKVLQQHTIVDAYFTFDVSDLPKGIYLINIQNNQSHNTKKLLVE